MQSYKTAQLLTSGGDARLVLNAQGVNKYGCRPTADDDVLAFSSSTATPISSQRFAVADELRIRLEQKLFSDEIYVQEVARQKAEWRKLIGLESDTRLIFSPSGTDLHGLVAKTMASNTLIITVEGNETGSGVAIALEQGRGVEIVAVSLRLKNGLPRQVAEINNDVIALTQKGIAENRDVLLILTDQSKTGMIAPSPYCAMQLKNQYKNSLSVLVDACQFRLSQATIKAYLQNNFMIALTGSKFLAAPSFSAMLLLPPTIEFLIEPEEANLGLLLRMEIALHEYRAFCDLTNTQISTVIFDFAQVVQSYLMTSPYFERLETLELNRNGLLKKTQWDSLPTIFSFVLCHDKKQFSQAETFALYQQLPLQNPRCQVGQPVAVGEGKSALRLCLSAPLIVQAAQNETQHRHCIEKALLVLATLEKNIFDCL